MTLPSDGVLVETRVVGSEWLDAAGEVREAFYLKAFDDAGDRLTELAGMGEHYTRTTANSWVALESHLGFVAPAAAGETVRIASRVVALDAKKIHVCQAMYRDELLLATHEQLGLHFDTRARRGCPFEPAVHARLAALVEAQRAAPQPAWLGRAIVFAAS